MTVREAHEVAMQWIHLHAGSRAEFRGAFIGGSTATLPAESLLPPSSDVDVFIVLSGDVAPPKPGKFVFSGVLIEATFIACAELDDLDRVAESYHLAHALAHAVIASDPTGRLQHLHDHVAATFDSPEWIERRCKNALTRIETRLAAIDTTAPWHDQVLAWLFPTGVTTHVVLVAARKNPTVRLRYLAAREVLSKSGFSGIYGQLLELLGAESVTPAQARRHLETLAATFDMAADLARTRFFFSSDITGAARPIAIDGSRELIDAGDHREAVFWIIVTFARCQKILAADAPVALQERLQAGFRSAAAELLQVRESADLISRAAAVRSFLPTLRSTARAIARQPASQFSA